MRRASHAQTGPVSVTTGCSRYDVDDEEDSDVRAEREAVEHRVREVSPAGMTNPSPADGLLLETLSLRKVWTSFYHTVVRSDCHPADGLLLETLSLCKVYRRDDDHFLRKVYRRDDDHFLRKVL